MKTLSDIAKEMGVSKSTVSYIYHDKWRAKRISPQLAAKVLEKLRQERAQPSMLGQQLRSGSTQTAGLLLPNLDQPYFLQLLAGLERRLGQENTMLFLGNAHRGAVLRQTEFIEAMVARSVDRVILSPVHSQGLTDLLERVRARQIPVVFVNNYLPDYDIPFAVSDNRWGAQQLVSQILSTGRRKILFVGISPYMAVSCDRLEGYREAFVKAGLKPPNDLLFWREGVGGEDNIVQQIRERFFTGTHPEAIFFDSFFASRKILIMIHGLGLKHPDDILLSGFDHPVDVPRPIFREAILAPLLTVQQDARRMGSLAAELSLHGCIKATGEQHLFIPPSLSWEAQAASLSADHSFLPMAQ